MKLFIALFIVSFSALSAHAAPCSPKTLQILADAQGADQGIINEALGIETPNFRCDVKIKNDLMFPAVCGAFQYAIYDYSVVSGPFKIRATVHHGPVSCYRLNKTVLVKSIIRR